MNCPNEQRVIAAIRVGGLGPELRKHVEQCPACEETARIAGAVAGSTIAMSIHRGDARILWLLAAERRQAEAERKLGRVVVAARLIAALAFLIAAAVRIVTAGGPPAGLLGVENNVGPVFLIAAAFVFLVVWTAQARGRSST